MTFSTAGLSAFDKHAISTGGAGRTHFEGTEDPRAIIELAHAIVGTSPKDARALLDAFVDCYPERAAELEAVVRDEPELDEL